MAKNCNIRADRIGMAEEKTVREAPGRGTNGPEVGRAGRGGKGMSTAVWLIVGALVLAGCLSGGKGKGDRFSGPHRIDRPHVIEPDDYECSVCHRRFRQDVMACPYCGAQFRGRVKDEEEFEDEEDELEAWDEEDGL